MQQVRVKDDVVVMNAVKRGDGASGESTATGEDEDLLEARCNGERRIRRFTNSELREKFTRNLLPKTVAQTARQLAGSASWLPAQAFVARINRDNFENSPGDFIWPVMA